MCNRFFDYDDGDFAMSISDNMAMDSDGDLMMRISSLKNPDCNEALKRVCSRIDLDAIHNFLEGVPELLPIQREFYLTMLTERKEKILDYSLELLMEQEHHTSPTQGM